MIKEKILADKISAEINSGYWKVNNCYFFDKSECLKYATQIKDFNITFHFFDEFYNSLSWDNEVRESLTELYKRRAEQLRSKYDYIVLAFSGGADSTTALNSFLYNNIHIDEVITSYPVSAIEKLMFSFDKSDKSAKNLMFEYTESVVPKLKEISTYYEKTKITVFDHSKKAIELITGGNLHKMPVAGFGAAPSLAGHYMIGERLRSLADKGKVAFLAGIDKPRIGYSQKTKNFGVWFDDVSTCWGHYNDYAFQGFKPNTEYFYYTLDMPEIWQKQCHVIMRIIENMNRSNELNSRLYQDIHFKSRSGSDVFSIHHDFFKKILYEDWDINTFQAGKPTSFFYQESAYWYLNTNLTTQAEKDFHSGQINELVSDIHDNFVVYDNNRKALKL